MKGFLLSGVVGGLIVWFLDPNSGSRRRNMARERIGSVSGGPGKTVTSTVQQATSKVSTTVKQTTETVKQTTGRRRDNPDPDDQTLRDRVESEVFRDPQFSRKNVNINVVNRVVELRGELPDQNTISTLIAAVRAVPDVLEVNSFLHTPGTPAPNKEEAIEASHDA